MMISINTSQKGFSLIELLVAMAIASVLMAGIFTFYHHQLKTHVTQQEMVDMQQDARAAMYMMTREIRMAGYDPQNKGEASIQTANVAEIEFESDIDGTADGDNSKRFYYALSYDDDRDGLSDGLADGTPCYLERGGWNTPLAPVPEDFNPVALNIDALNFVYLDSAGNTLNDDGNGNVTANLAAIRSVQITLVARSGDKVPALMRKRTDRTTYTNQQGQVILPAPNDNFRRIRLTTAVKVRNLGL
jgi:type IV pilus assembly protein PilW